MNNSFQILNIIYLVNNSDLKYKAHPIYFESKVMSFGYKKYFVFFYNSYSKFYVHTGTSF